MSERPLDARDQFAAAALTGIMANRYLFPDADQYKLRWAVERSYEIADVMLAARAKRDAS